MNYRQQLFLSFSLVGNIQSVSSQFVALLYTEGMDNLKPGTHSLEIKHLQIGKDFCIFKFKYFDDHNFDNLWRYIGFMVE